MLWQDENGTKHVREYKATQNHPLNIVTDTARMQMVMVKKIRDASWLVATNTK